MFFWKFFEIGHRDHLFCNPTSEASMDELIVRLALPTGARVFDVACGKAEWLTRVVSRCDGTGVGVDLGPGFVAEARANVQAKGLADRIEIVEANGAEYQPEGRFDLVSCLGASWIFDGHAGTLRALARWAKPGGLVVVGEPFWRQDPPDAYLAATELERGAFGSHARNVETGLEQGLGLLYTQVSTEPDFERYEALQWNALERYAREAPEDPDVPELLARMRRERDAYLSWGRDGLGWAIYVFLLQPYSASRD